MALGQQYAMNVDKYATCIRHPIPHVCNGCRECGESADKARAARAKETK